MRKHFKSIGTSKSYVNGKKVNNRGYAINFNGNKMSLTVKKNKTKTIFNLTRNEIRKLKKMNKTKRNKRNSLKYLNRLRIKLNKN